MSQRCACATDVHAHVVPGYFPQCLAGTVPTDWPSMAPADACHRHVMMSGRVYRTVSDRCWNAPKRIEDMAGMGVALQALSPMPELMSYWMAPGPAGDLLRFINDQIAEMAASAPDRFVGLGAVPLQDVEAAIAELHRVMDELGQGGNPLR